MKLYQQARKLKVEDISLDNILKKEEKQVVSHRRKHLGHGFRGEGFLSYFTCLLVVRPLVYLLSFFEPLQHNGTANICVVALLTTSPSESVSE